MNACVSVEDDWRRAVDILDRAFHDDPLMNWLSQHPDFRRTFFTITLPFFLKDGLTYVEERGRGAAAWLGPERELEWPVTTANLLRLFRVSGAKGFYRFARAGLTTAKFRPGEPHYYLFLLGALPECQGQGVGSTLISHVLRTCDDENLPAYLENSKRENIRFYQGHGFEVVDRVQIARRAPPVWLMWREPNPGR
ncbi:MAG: GNAT family N-acetyltransferase [Pseudomonadota bacterium]